MRVNLPLIAVVLMAAACPAQVWTLRKTCSPGGASELAYVDYLGLTVAFGGRGPNGLHNETWGWDGVVWKQRRPVTAPSPRWNHAMAYSPATRRLYLFGGESTSALGDMWIYVNDSWLRVYPRTSPPARSLHQMVWDSKRHRLMLFGGTPGPQGPYFDDLWEYDSFNNTWVKIPATGPVGRVSFAMGYSASAGETVIFGGLGNQRPLTDVWHYRSGAWRVGRPPVLAYGRGAEMAYDSDRGELIVSAAPSRLAAIDSNGVWRAIDPQPGPPVTASSWPMTYDPVRQRMVMAVGPQTWEFAQTPEPLVASPASISIATGGTQTFQIDAGPRYRGKSYWVFGSITGSCPGIRLPPVTIPLNVDAWTNLTISAANSATLVGTRGILDTSGRARASLVVPRITNPGAIGVEFHHAYLVTDSFLGFVRASNPVSLVLRR